MTTHRHMTLRPRRGRDSTSSGAGLTTPATGTNNTPLGRRRGNNPQAAAGGGQGNNLNRGTPVPQAETTSGTGGQEPTGTLGVLTGTHQGPPGGTRGGDHPHDVVGRRTDPAGSAVNRPATGTQRGPGLGSEQIQAFSRRIAELEARLAASIRGQAQGSNPENRNASNPRLLESLIDSQRKANEVMARLVSRTWKPPSHVVEFSEDQDWCSYHQYLLPLSGSLEATQEVRLITEKCIRVPRGKKIPQHEYLPQLIWDQTLVEVAHQIGVPRVDTRNEVQARHCLNSFYSEMTKRFPEKRSTVKVEAMRKEIRRNREKDESMEAFMNSLIKANLLLGKHKPELKLTERIGPTVSGSNFEPKGRRSDEFGDQETNGSNGSECSSTICLLALGRNLGCPNLDQG